MTPESLLLLEDDALLAEQTRRDAAAMLSQRYPGLAVEALVGDFTLHLSHLPARKAGGSRMVAFLGSTIGNLYLEERRAFLGALADSLDPGDWLLLEWRARCH